MTATAAPKGATTPPPHCDRNAEFVTAPQPIGTE